MSLKSTGTVVLYSTRTLKLPTKPSLLHHRTCPPFPALTTTRTLHSTETSNAPSRPTPSHASRRIHYRTTTSLATAMESRFKGKTIIITGASSGIGRATALELARTSPTSLQLILTARRIDTLKEVEKDIEKEVGKGVRVLSVQQDLSKKEEVEGFVQRLPEGWREIDVLVNNAYVLPLSFFTLPLHHHKRSLTLPPPQRPRPRRRPRPLHPLLLPRNHAHP